jgi:hypothetical protein
MKRYSKAAAWVLLILGLWFSQAFFMRSDSDDELHGKITWVVMANIFLLSCFLAWMASYEAPAQAFGNAKARALLLGRWIALTLAIVVLALFDYQASYDILIWRH